MFSARKIFFLTLLIFVLTTVFLVVVFLKSANLPPLPKRLGPNELLTYVRVLKLPKQPPENPEPGKIYTFRYEKTSYPETLLTGKILAIDSENRFLTVGEGKSYQAVRIADQAEFHIWWQKLKPSKEEEESTPPAPPFVIQRLEGDGFSELKEGDEVQLTGIEQWGQNLLCRRVVKLVE